MRAAASRISSKLSSSRTEPARAVTSRPLALASAFCSLASASLREAASLKCWDVICIGIRSRREVRDTVDKKRALRAPRSGAPTRASSGSFDLFLGHSGQHLGYVQYPGPQVATPAQPPLDVQHAAEIPQHQRVGAGPVDVRAFEVGDTRGNVAELDREGATEAAALLRLLHLLDLQPGDLFEQCARLDLHAHLTQSR